MNKETIRARIPEIEWIKDDDLRNKCLDTWLYAAEFSNVTDQDIDQVTFAGHVLNGCTMNLIEHTRTVIQVAALLSDQFNKTYGDRTPADRDIVLCAAALHDVGKLQEHGLDHKGIFFEENDYLKHGWWGAYFAQHCGCPWKVVYSILTHSDESPDKKHIPESYIVFNADWMNFRYLSFGYDQL